jgi:hypothetical protein
MVRLWSEEVGDAKSVIEPLVREIDPEVKLDIDGEEGFRRDTVEVHLRKGQREAHCVVTFEAWTNAGIDPTEMKSWLQDVIGALNRGEPPPANVLTSRGPAQEDSGKGTEVLREIAAGTEADVLAEQFLKRSGRQ